MRTRYEQPVSLSESFIAMNIEICRVIDFETKLCRRSLQPEDDKVFVLEKVGGCRPVERDHTGMRANKIARVEAVSSPFIVGLIRVRAEFKKNVPGFVLVRDYDISDIEIAPAVGPVDEVDGVIAGRPSRRVDIL